MLARYLLVALLAGCTASNWQKQDATTADLDRDYDECRVSAKPDLVVPAIAGAFGAAGVFVGTTYNDTRIRDCLRAKGWTVAPNGPEASALATAPAGAAGTTAASSQTAAAGAGPVRTAEAQTPAARRLRELNLLRDQGLITKDEYEERRRAILGAI